VLTVRPNDRHYCKYYETKGVKDGILWLTGWVLFFFLGGYLFIALWVDLSPTLNDTAVGMIDGERDLAGPECLSTDFPHIVRFFFPFFRLHFRMYFICTMS
jgi:hypothetical protein